MTARNTDTTVRTLDGLRLAGTLTAAEAPSGAGVVLVHGAGVTREEGGFFTRLADRLADAGMVSLRFDLPGHGASDGRQEDVTLSSVLNVIRAGLDHLRAVPGVHFASLIAASFSGGAAAYYAAKRPDELRRLVLFNPLLDYKRRFVDEKPAWDHDYISEKAGRQLAERGYVGHSPTFRLGRAMLNEVFWLQPRTVLHEIKAATLIVHGTEDTFIPVESSREADAQLQCVHELVQLAGAQHGFAVHDDPEYVDPQSQQWQAYVIQTVSEWLAADS